MASLSIKFMAASMQIDFLPTEFKSLALAERNGLHTQRLGIEVCARADIGYCQNQMIEAVEGQGHGI